MARFIESKKGLGKFAFEGNSPKSKSDDAGYRAKVRLIANGDIFNIVEDSTYLKSEKETGKTTIAHKDAKYWDYFWKEIFVDGKGYDVVINIRNDSKTGILADKTQFVYSMSFNENKKVATPVTTPASSKLVGVNLGVPTINSIPQKSDLSTDLAKKYLGETKYDLGDAPYMEAVKRGDMETAQRMVDKAAKRAGYDVTTYHGTEADFTEFKTIYVNEFGYHVGTKAAAEDRVQYRLNSKVLKLYTKLGKTIRTPDVFGYLAGMHDYIFYVRGELDKVSDMGFLKQDERTKKYRNKFPRNSLLDALHDSYVDFVESGYKGSKAKAVVENTQAYLKSIGVDSITYTNTYESVGSTSYLLMSPEQVKLADAVTLNLKIF